MNKTLPLITAALASAAALQSAHAGAFTPGNVVVERIGDGTAALTSAGTAVFVDEYLPATTQTTPVNTVALPTVTAGLNNPLTDSGSATSTGQFSRSVDRTTLVLPGYGAATGTAGVTSAAGVNRVIGTINAAGVVNTTTSLPQTDLYSGNNFRGVASANGSSFYTAGTATAATTGPHYVASVGATSSTQLNTTLTNTRAIGIFGGQVYATSGSTGFIGVNAVGTGLPTTSGQTSALTIDTSTTGTGTASPYAFTLFNTASNPVSGLNTAYIADDRSAANGGGVQKFTFNGTSWTLAYILTDDATLGARGLAFDALTGRLLVTTAGTSANNLVSIVDGGSALASTFTVLATAPTNEAFRGVAFSPVAAPEPSTWAMIAGGLASLGLMNRARSRHA